MTKTRVRILRIFTLLLFSYFFGAAMHVGAQEPAEEPTPEPTPGIHVEDDPTKPIFFSIRNEYRNLRNGAWANTVLFRFDKLTLRNLKTRGGANGLIFRFDIPFNIVNNGSDTKSGLGDLYAQVLYIPHVRPSFSLALGSGVSLPTATNDQLGQGKLILSPAIVPVWRVGKKRRLFLIRFQNYFSVAGKRSRPDVNYLVVDPKLIRRLSRKWWILADTEFKWDWKSRRGSGISGVQFGRMLKKRIGVWIEPEVPWGPGRLGDFTLKLTFFRIR